jgi:hypothetical protein
VESFRSELRGILPAWLVCTLLPLPAIAFWRFLGGEPLAHFCFFICCMSLVASRFRLKVIFQQAPPSWHVKMLAVGVALLAASIVFSLLWLTLADAHDLVTPFIAFQSLIPSFCIVPYLSLVTGKPAAAVILSAFLVGCMKMVAGIVVNLVYGWNYGHHELPWTDPNLMLWSFWVATAILSVSLFFLGANKYRAQLGRVT